jgi:formylglycine-generating enzyme required for sulfatase activity
LNTTDGWRYFLSLYRTGPYAEQAKKEMIRCEVFEKDDAKAWVAAIKQNTLDAYRLYLGSFPKGKHADEAKLKAPPPRETKGASEYTLGSENDGFVYVQGGTFIMGCKNETGKPCLPDEKPAHQETVNDFYICAHEVTQDEWRAIMGNDPPLLSFPGCDRCPVERISWDDAVEFVDSLNSKSKHKYRLPTEVEWEFAAKGGIQCKGFRYAGSNTLDSVGWYLGNSGNKTHPVGLKQPNELGLYDMTGNVWEWTSDLWTNSYQTSSIVQSTKRSRRGGSWASDVSLSRVECRHNGMESGVRGNCVGLRLVRSN